MMKATLRRFLFCAGPQAVPVLLLASAAVMAVAIWLFAHDRAELNAASRMRAERGALDLQRLELEVEIERAVAEIATQQKRVRESQKIIDQLKQLESPWDWLVGDREQQRTNAERRKRMEALHAEASARILALRQENAQRKWQLDQKAIERDRLDDALARDAADRKAWSYLVRRTWIHARSWIIAAFSLILLAPVAGHFASRSRLDRRS